MYCRNCGQEIEETDTFCVNCGTPVQPPAAQLVQAAATAGSAFFYADSSSNGTASCDNTWSATYASNLRTAGVRPGQGSVRQVRRANDLWRTHYITTYSRCSFIGNVFRWQKPYKHIQTAYNNAAACICCGAYCQT